jgi:broad specificity phosphatase PhoE
MTDFLLIRHGHTPTVDRLISGRMAHIGLTPEGWAQAERLAERLACEHLDAILTSPLQRARETAEPLARRHGLSPRIEEGLNEIASGAWEGREFVDLEQDVAWRRFNTFRTGTRIPGGELIVEVQARMASTLERLRSAEPDARIALVSHGDPIKAVLCYYMGMPLDLMLRLEVATASVSRLRITADEAQILCINC